MANEVTIIIYSGDKATDISNLVESVVWKGRKGSSARTLGVTLIDDDGFQHSRSGINVEEGYYLIFRFEGTELFRGIIMSQKQDDKKTMTIAAYDYGIYLANNKDTFVYENKTADYIFKDVCQRFGIEVGEVAKCSYVIPELTKSKTTGFDTICDALSLDFDATGVRHYVSCTGEKMNLLTRRQNILQWVFETGKNISNYTYTRSIEKIITRVKMVSKEGEVVAEKKLEDLESRIGIFQDVDTPDEEMTDAQINSLIQNMLEEKGSPEKTISLTTLGKTDVISGLGVFIIIPELDLKKTFYVDEDSHEFKDGIHTMTLKLNEASDIGKDDSSSSSSSGDYNVGDKVYFKGGYHYVASSASDPAGGKVPEGPAEITYTAKGAKHPWHLVHTDSSTWVYGWVDDGTFE